MSSLISSVESGIASDNLNGNGSSDKSNSNDGYDHCNHNENDYNDDDDDDDDDDTNTSSSSRLLGREKRKVNRLHVPNASNMLVSPREAFVKISALCSILTIYRIDAASSVKDSIGMHPNMFRFVAISYSYVVFFY